LTAPELLAIIENRGGVVTAKADPTGAAKLHIAPRGLVPDLAGEIQKFKPALLEILAASAPPEPAPHPTLAVWCPDSRVWKRRDSDAIFPTLKTLGACMEVQHAKRAAAPNQPARPQSEVPHVD
jgi:hypothetical protein